MKLKLVLIGGGGHCASCIDVIEQEGRFEIAGIVDPALAGETLLGYPGLGGDEALARLRASCDHAFIAVGQIKTPSVRQRLFANAKALGFRLPTIVSPRAYVSRHATVGEGTIIMHDALVNARAVIGNNCIINTKALIEHDATIEDDCHVSTGAIINGGTRVRKGSFVGSNAVTKEGVQTPEGAFIKAGSQYKGEANG
jgi:sugar O-acyltransferase (sialic acid O-acetyltransferase NeuD family)